MSDLLGNRPFGKTRLFVGDGFRALLLVVASANFLWFSFQSRIYQSFITDKISFCVVCTWYWDLSFGSPPVLILIVTTLFLPRNRALNTFAFLLSTYLVFQGFAWFRSPSGFPGSVIERIEIVTGYDHIHWWELKDLQYIFGIVVFLCVSYGTIKAFTKMRKPPPDRLY